MSGYPPPPGQVPGPGEPGGHPPVAPKPDNLYGGSGSPPAYRQAPAPQSARRGARVIVLAAVFSVLLGGGAFAFYQADPLHLLRAGPQAAEAIPADALFYVGADLDPSAKQKVAALQFFNSFPAFRKNSGLSDANADVRRAIFDGTVAHPCAALSYDDDVQPWIGSKFAVAGMPSPRGRSAPGGMAALEVTNQDRARAGLAKLQKCSDGSGQGFGFTFIGNYAVVAQTQRQAETYAHAAESASLAEDDDFAADMESLGELGVLTAWADVTGAIDSFGG